MFKSLLAVAMQGIASGTCRSAWTVALSMLLIAPSYSAIQIAPNTSVNVKDVAAQCKDGCLILSQSEVKAVEANVNAFAKEAYHAGVAQGVQSCRKDQKDI